jgi:PTH1 family peptidyl-tRNA hydrolase
MIIFGLGNPGLRYRHTRHNAGHLFLERLAKHYKKRFSRRQYYTKSVIAIDTTEVILVKPKCWMNLCGSTVQRVLERYDEDFMVVLDDINLPLGRMRLRSKGSDGGHLGLRSVIDALRSTDFPRLRIGIGQPESETEDYVLSRFTTAERKTLLEVIDEGINGIQIMVGQGFVRAQNHINAVDIKDVS